MHRLLYIFLLLHGFLGLTTACPQLVAAICHCSDLHNGVILNCSDTDGGQTLQILKASQSSLGLIQELTMQRAHIKRLPAGFFSGLYIKRLDLSWNEMEDIDDTAFVGMSPVLQELVLNHNKLTTVPSLQITTLKTLLRLDLSNNSIGDLQQEHALPTLPKLYDVNLANNKICDIHKSMFEGAKNSLQTINLGHNCLKAVPAPALRGFKELMSLHLHHNLIATLDSLSFMNLPLLNLLNLAHNRISEVNRQAFLNVPNLRYLYLTHNKITTVFPHQFAAFDQLEMLDLTHNLLLSVPKDSFSHLPLLRQLYLGNNKIATVDEDAFTNSSIVILILASNQIKELPEGAFNGLPTLQQLSLKDNQLKTLHQNLFYNTPAIVMLDLSENELIDLPPAIFLAQLKLLLIDLSKNKIIRTPYAAFNRRVATVLLQENPLVCTEKVHMLQEGVGVYVPNSDDVVCGGKPKPSSTTTTTTTTATVPLPPEDVELELASAQRQSEGEPILNIADGRRPLIRPISTQQSIQEKQLIPVRPINAPSGAKPAGAVQHSLNYRPTPASRSRGMAGSEIDFSSGFQDLLPSASEESEETTMTTVEPSSRVRNIKTTTVKPPRRYTDIADNPNIIHPFPVPFLKRGPHLSQSFYASSTGPPDNSSSMETTTIAHTLPPSIVIASHFGQRAEMKEEPQSFEEFALRGQPKDVTDEEEENKSKGARFASPTTIIIACLSTVAIVMIAVFVGLCVARHKQVTRFGSNCSDSTAARTNAYVAAQAAQLNMIYGTMERNRSTGAMRPLPPDDPNTWMYAATAGTYSYYK